MRKIIILSILILCYSVVFSQSYILNIKFTNGSKKSYNIDDIQKVNFTNITQIHDLKRFNHIIKSFKLLQNYPNPFNPTTQIKYEIPKSGKAILTIYDLNGRKVKTLISGLQSIGIHKVTWDGKNNKGQKVSSGLYFYTLKYGNSIQTKKMILVK